MRNFKLRPDLAIDFDGRKLFRIEAVCDYVIVRNDAHVYNQGSMKNE